MELPINTLVIIAIAVIVLLAIVVGIILPARSGGEAISKNNDFTLVCNSWAASGCGEKYFYDNEDKVRAAASCASLSDCQCKCEKAGFCASDPSRRC
ncbi:MAG: hypothetical protein WA139_04050 [Candidatus Aenigmatarchaeota archaeon]